MMKKNITAIAIAAVAASMLSVSTAQAFEPSAGAYADPKIKREYKPAFQPAQVKKNGATRQYKCSWDGKQINEGATVGDGDNSYKCVATYKKSWGGKTMKTKGALVLVEK